MKKLISCASYYGSGSSAITDLISEYKGVKSLTEYEFRFIHDIDGIMDLEYHLVMNPNRHNSGHALKRFWRLAQFNAGTKWDKRYSIYFGSAYLNLSKKYVEELTDLKFPGCWFMDLYERGKWFYYWKSIEGKILKKIFPNKTFNKMPQEETYCSHPSEQKFLELTRSYIAGIIKAANPEDADYLMMDQLTPSSNINRCLRYFDDNIRTFVVDRDPRDIYVINKTVWKTTIIPTNPIDFCKWYGFTHGCAKGQEVDTTKVMKIQFEDLIYRYDEMVSKIEKFIGLSAKDHEFPFRGMNPKRSVYNTWLFKNYPYMDEIKYIEEHLNEYIYDFESVGKNCIMGIAPHSITKF